MDLSEPGYLNTYLSNQIKKEEPKSNFYKFLIYPGLGGISIGLGYILEELKNEKLSFFKSILYYIIVVGSYFI
jgi:hypothetical protein